MFNHDPSLDVLGAVLVTAIVMGFLVVLAYIKGMHAGRRLRDLELEDLARKALITKGLGGAGWPGTSPDATPSDGASTPRQSNADLPPLPRTSGTHTPHARSATEDALIPPAEILAALDGIPDSEMFADQTSR